MTSLASSDDGPEPSPGYCVPRHVTGSGRRAFHKVVRGFAAQLAEQMELDAQRAGEADPEYTGIQVHNAQRVVERRNALRSEPDRSDHAVLGAILVSLGSLGVAVLSNFLVGLWQVVSFVVFALVLGAGLILTWTGRPRTPPRGEP